MKTLIINPTTDCGVIIRKSDNNFEIEYSTQSLNWWINEEVPYYISIGYKIDVSPQYYNAKTKRFI
jgi:hypothetical protein